MERPIPNAQLQAKWIISAAENSRDLHHWQTCRCIIQQFFVK